LIGSKIIKSLGVLIILLVCMSAAYAADSTDQNSKYTSDQGNIDSGASDVSTDSGVSDDSGADTNDPVLYYATSELNSADGSPDSALTDDPGSDTSDPGSSVTVPLSDDPGSDTSDNGTVTDDGSGTNEDSYILASADESRVYKDVSSENNSVQFDPDHVRSSAQKDPQQVKNDKIPMQKTGVPILPAVASIITIMGGFLVNKFKS